MLLMCCYCVANVLLTLADAQVAAQVRLTLELIGPSPCVAYTHLEQHRALVYTCQVMCC